MVIKIVLGCVAALMALFLIILVICFLKVFYSPRRRPLADGEYDIPKGEVYKAFRKDIEGWVDEVRTLPHEKIEIVSHDGLVLRGRYYEYRKGAPVEILFHGYRGSSDRDMCAGVSRSFAVGRNALLVDQRASGASDGSVISFGINERLDCLRWVEHLNERFNGDVEIILTGISMGAATVMMASAEKLPPNVVCVLADCGYTSVEAIIRKVLRDMHLPPGIFYPLVRLSARIFGGFDPNATSPLEAVKMTDIPIIFIHGDADGFVPCEMSEELFEACASLKKLVKIHGADHGLAYPTDREGYVKALKDFEVEWRSQQNIRKAVDK
jgi:fermentation-respiration switch protein FrsA (DUF1100 family)